MKQIFEDWDALEVGFLTSVLFVISSIFPKGKKKTFLIILFVIFISRLLLYKGLIVHKKATLP